MVVNTSEPTDSAPAAAPSGWRQVVLSDDPKQQLRIQRFLVALINYTILGALLAYLIRQGTVELEAASGLLGFMILSQLGLYTVLRSGVMRRCKDPSLTFPQIMVAVVAVIWSYAILGETRGATLILLALVLTFGMFTLSPEATRAASILTLGLLVITMGAMTLRNPQRFPLSEEITHFLFVCTTLPTISLLSAQLTMLRRRLESRKNELTEALERIQLLATRDELTGLYNRRHMMEALRLQRAQSERTGQPFCVALIDLDHFKQINDTHGHGVGDEVLRRFAEVARRCVRESDLLARWGGEEFLLMLPAGQLPQARISLDRLHDAVRMETLAPSVPHLGVRFSAGLTEQRPGETLEATIERADQALYEAKHLGRNRTAIA